ncbi:hypothetical protein KUTeg_012196 [Tegillarca granosa]|uniref:Phospholipid-transporting ATPase n=1 Tax=Tegillarca granosa TaxID=220873 RepID=A0ABQ9F2A1_TEGGR|nr:hypothetical protein KUTeg_012196 [Tegillarca granosa]
MPSLINRIGQSLGCMKKPRPRDRTVLVDNKPPTNHDVYIPDHYPDNRVVSSKYTVFTFLPKNLFEQFRRIANFYFLCVGIIQGYEDWLRHKADNEENNRIVSVVRNGKLTKLKSMNIRVGDIVKVEINHSFPCDLVMLSSSDPEGSCYVTTANLDGETNLKNFTCLAETKLYQTEESFDKLHAYIECEQPKTDLYSFIGKINIVTDNGHICDKSLGPENVLLRGARLRNTAFVYGCAIYTGQETKMALNSTSKATKKLNTFLIIFLVILLLESLVSVFLKYWYISLPNIGKPWYVPTSSREDGLNPRSVIENFLAYMVIYNYIIPISMYVEYLFTDKTGTLTENDMQFRQCSVNGIKYEEVGGMLCQRSPTGGQSNPVAILSPELENFFTVLVLCHTCRVDYPEAHATGAATGAATMYSHTGMDYEYQASSPDEKAFLEACRRYGIVYHGQHEGRLEVTFKGEMRRYKLLHVLDFDPTRKRMSVIIQTEQDEIYLLCKGAESAVLNRAHSGDTRSTLQHVDEYALLGLRTLVISSRRFTEQEYQKINNQLKEARIAMENREQKLADAFDEIEQNLNILGATAVEDKLQEDVPKTISSLQRAGIMVWVLTGDKEETAINISHSAGHFKRGMVELKLTKITDANVCAEQITQHIKTIMTAASAQQFALVIDGMTLALAIPEHQNLLRDLCQLCVSVLCCRMSPLQKAEVVKLIKHAENNPVTAAIGDGANDVSMIQEAHVGIGIMGKEGRQAVRSSDYAFAKFRFLMRALLVHGSFYYIRLSTLVQFFFYKNVAFITGQLFYSFYNAYSQQTLFDSFYLMFYNITFSSLPIFIYSLFEQHLPQSTLLDKPELYRKISRNEKLSIKLFIGWNALGLWHTFVFFFGVLFMFGNDVSLFKDGKMMDNTSFGSIVFTTCVIAVNLKLCLQTYYWCLPIFLSYIITGVGNVAMELLYTSVFWPSLFKPVCNNLGLFPCVLYVTIYVFLLQKPVYNHLGLFLCVVYVTIYVLYYRSLSGVVVLFLTFIIPIDDWVDLKLKKLCFILIM